MSPEIESRLKHNCVFYFSVQAKAIENSRKRSVSVAAGHQGAAGGSKPKDDDIQGPEYYAGRIAAI